eukprot:296948-Rhodomonas_salina.3
MASRVAGKSEAEPDKTVRAIITADILYANHVNPRSSIPSSPKESLNQAWFRPQKCCVRGEGLRGMQDSANQPKYVTEFEE